MRKRIIFIVAVYLTFVFALNLIGCSKTEKKVSTDKVFEQTIEEKLNNITNPKDMKILTSSNPYDYVNAANEDYKYIVSQGEKSLNYMLDKFAKSKMNGLKEYVMAIACSEILEENPASKHWATGREWYNNYIKSNK